MRTKRRQKHRQKVEAASAPPPMLDPFSELNPGLVDREEREIRCFRDACPCCLDMAAQQEIDQLENLYLADRRE